MKRDEIRKRFGCIARKVEYDFRRKTGSAWFEEGHCCDMDRCLDFFSGIDREVQSVFTFNPEPDVAYVKTDGEWFVWPPGFWTWNSEHGAPVVRGELVEL